MQPSEIQALIQLLDDPDEGVYQHVREALLGQGEQLLPWLRSERHAYPWADLHGQRLDELVHGLHFAALRNRSVAWGFGQERSVLEGAIILEEAVMPHADGEGIRAAFQKLRRDAWLEMDTSLTTLEQVRLLNHTLFERYGLAKLHRRTPQPGDALLGQVLQQRKGNPVGIGMLYLALAQSLEMPLYPVQLRHHFLLCCHDEDRIPEKPGSGADASFYIHPFGKGSIILPGDIEDFISESERQAGTFCAPCPVEFAMERHFYHVAWLLEQREQTSLARQVRELIAPWASKTEHPANGGNHHPEI
ncbi:MAG: hypothetical protein RJA19_1109 [Bacteroidota bacterium]|jgi:hypothetical protein